MRDKKSDVYIDDEGNLINIHGDHIETLNVDTPSMDEKSDTFNQIDTLKTISVDDMNDMYEELERNIDAMGYDEDIKKEILDKAKTFIYNSKDIIFSINELANNLLLDFEALRSMGDDLPEISEQSLLSVLTLLFVSTKYRDEIRRLLDNEL